MEPQIVAQTTTNKMADPSELELSTPQRSQYISGKKRNNPDSPDSYSPSDKQLEKQPRTFSPLSKSLENVIVDQVTSDTVVQRSDVVCATLNNPDFISSIIPTIAEKVIQLMQPQIEQMVKDAIQPHTQPLLDKQVILEETVSQLQNNNANLKAQIDLIDMRLEEQEQYSRWTSLRFHNARVPTDQKGNIIQPVDTHGIVLKICNKDLTVPLDIHHIGRSHPIGEANDGKISIIVRFLTYRQRHMVLSNKRKLKGNKDKMFIAENLTKYRYDLLRELNGMKEINKVHSFWTYDGSILVKES
jgi:hypothetical protein